MKKYLTFIFLISFISSKAQDIRIPLDTTVITNSEVLINGQKQKLECSQCGMIMEK